MSDNVPEPGRHLVISKPDLQCVFDALRELDFILVGPTLAEGSVIYDELTSIEDLPVGWADHHSPGHYRLERTGDDQYFAYVVGPHSWKKYLYPTELKLFSAARNGNGFQIEARTEAPRHAFIGVRACELAAIAIQDRIFLGGPFDEPHYKARRERAFILAVNCTDPGETCFCASMGTGPKVEKGFDLALTELEDSFLVEAGSEIGAKVLAGCRWELAGAYAMTLAQRLMEEAGNRMGRHMDTADLPHLLLDNLDHPRWDDVAERCLSCMNCTSVCPTCFCVDVRDVSDLTGKKSERVRVWDSCFNPDFSYIHGGNLRPSIRARYRQWLTHKLASWEGQFDSLGCVGCGRCITWCPVGIDLTEEVAVIRQGDA